MGPARPARLLGSLGVLLGLVILVRLVSTLWSTFVLSMAVLEAPEPPQGVKLYAALWAIEWLGNLLLAIPIVVLGGRAFTGGRPSAGALFRVGSLSLALLLISLPGNFAIGGEELEAAVKVVTALLQGAVIILARQVWHNQLVLGATSA